MAKTTKKTETTAKKAPAAKKTATAKKAAPKTKAAPKAKAAPKEAVEDKVEAKVEKTLLALYSLQQIDTQIDKIRIVRGELPLEVQDLEDEIVGLETRVNNHKTDIETIEKNIKEKQEDIKNSLALIKKYEDQQMNVRNNREYDSLSKEIEFQTLEIQLSEKRINENKVSLETKKQEIEDSEELLTERKKDLEVKNSELADIVTETENEEKDLVKAFGRRYIDYMQSTARFFPFSGSRASRLRSARKGV